ncbi:hypothetical protein ACFYWU_39445 [Streptomyces chrestomyceticus]|uniref:hypothetical protein n=1 Tax=Streptomyces chrestomyceticus TaxID=68185 RepID=UPI00367E4072
MLADLTDEEAPARPAIVDQATSLKIAHAIHGAWGLLAGSVAIPEELVETLSCRASRPNESHPAA